MRVLQVIPDDKFWRCVLEVFSSYNCDYDYVCLVPDSFENYRYINSEVIRPVPVSKINGLFEKEYNVIIFHSIPPYLYSCISKIDLDKVIVVSSWGYDIYLKYNRIPPIINLQIYKKNTRKLLKPYNLYSAKEGIIQFIKNYFPVGRNLKWNNRIKERTANSAIRLSAIQRVDYWATVLPNEFDIISKINGFTAKYFPFQYTSKDYIEKNEYIDFDNAQYILVGNSADPSNNHIDVLKLLMQRKIYNKLYIPLAYGNMNYAGKVSSFVNSNNIDAIIQSSFVPSEEYQRLIGRCRVGVFGHIRQQAVGNINLCLYQGSKVYLFKDSIAYQYYKSQGFFVFTIENDLTEESVNEPLTRFQMKTNVEKLSFFSLSNVQERVKSVMTEIEGSIETKLF